VTATLPWQIAVGDRPRATGFGLLAGLLAAVVAATLRVVDPTILLGAEPSLLAAAAGTCLAAAVGRYRGGVLAGILAAALPVFAVDAATFAVRDPVTPGLVARAAAAAAWYTTGVAVLLAGPLGYALGARDRPATAPSRGRRPARTAASHPSNRPYSPPGPPSRSRRPQSRPRSRSRSPSRRLPRHRSPPRPASRSPPTSAGALAGHSRPRSPAGSASPSASTSSHRTSSSPAPTPSTYRRSTPPHSSSLSAASPASRSDSSDTSSAEPSPTERSPTTRRHENLATDGHSASMQFPARQRRAFESTNRSSEPQNAPHCTAPYASERGLAGLRPARSRGSFPRAGGARLPASVFSTPVPCS
jgi:hypothetical protein